MKKKEFYHKINQVKKTLGNFRQYIVEKQATIPAVEERKIIKPISYPKEEVHRINFSATTIFKCSFIALGTFYFLQWLGSITSILLIMFAAIVIASAFVPIVDYFQRFHIPRAVTVLLIYIGFFTIFGFMISSIVPFLIDQLTALASTTLVKIKILSSQGFEGVPYGHYLQSIFDQINQEKVIEQLQDSIQNIVRSLGTFSGSFFTILSTILGNVFTAIVILVITFYMIMEKAAISNFFNDITTGPHQAWITTRGAEIVKKMGAWLRG